MRLRKAMQDVRCYRCVADVFRMIACRMAVVDSFTECRRSGLQGCAMMCCSRPVQAGRQCAQSTYECSSIGMRLIQPSMVPHCQPYTPAVSVRLVADILSLPLNQSLMPVGPLCIPLLCDATHDRQMWMLASLVLSFLLH